MADAEDVPPILLPCTVCARTFIPNSLEKHKRICEKTNVKKRKPFDSSKQRIQGTELEEFIPKQGVKRTNSDDETGNRKNYSWKETRDEFLRTIRAARGDSGDTPSKLSTKHVTTKAPTKANEKGTCPTCNRQFGIKAYDRHVTWCKERLTRASVINPTSSIAKERLEARIRYRAPALKKRRPTIREKYMPGSATNFSYAYKISPPVSVKKPRESMSLSNCNQSNDVAVKQKPTPWKTGHAIDSSLPSKSVRPRTMDQLISKHNKTYDPFFMAEQQMRDLLLDTSEQSSTDGTSIQTSHQTSTHYPLMPLSAFIKYFPETPSSPDELLEKRTPSLSSSSALHEVTSDFTSNSTDMNAITRELVVSDISFKNVDSIGNSKNRNQFFEHGILPLKRKVVMDKLRVLGNDVEDLNQSWSSSSSVDRTRKIQVSIPKITSLQPRIDRSHLVRTTPTARKLGRKSSISTDLPSFSKKSIKYPKNTDLDLTDKNNDNHTNNSNCNSSHNDDSHSNTMDDSNLSLNSIVSPNLDMKRSDSMLDEFMSIFEVDSSTILPSIRSFLKSDPSSMSNPMQSSYKLNGQISDDEFSPPDSSKRPNHDKLSADSAYSSLNRKYCSHGRSADDEISPLEGDPPAEYSGRDFRKMSKFCHECGSKFPESAKFCCECGFKRLTL